MTLIVDFYTAMLCFSGFTTSAMVENLTRSRSESCQSPSVAARTFWAPRCWTLWPKWSTGLVNSLKNSARESERTGSRITGGLTTESLTILGVKFVFFFRVAKGLTVSASLEDGSHVTRSGALLSYDTSKITKQALTLLGKDYLRTLRKLFNSLACRSTLAFMSL